MGTKCPKASKCIYPDPCGIKNTNLDLNIQNNYGCTGFYYACSNGDLPILDYCIKNTNLDVNKKDNVGNTGIHYACQEGHLEIVEYFKVDAFAYFWALCAQKQANVSTRTLAV